MDVSADMGPRRVRGEVTGSMVLAQGLKGKAGGASEVACFKLDEAGKVFDANRAGLKLLGAESPEDAIGKDFVVDLVSEVGREGVADAIGKALGGEAQHGVSVPLAVGEDGASKWVEGDVEQLLSASGEVLGTLVKGTDVSDEERAQQAAADKELLDVLDKMGICALFTDKQGVVDNCNKKACSMLGLSLIHI